jgi:hypothetical protein
LREKGYKMNGLQLVDQAGNEMMNWRPREWNNPASGWILYTLHCVELSAVFNAAEALMAICRPP